MQLQPKDAVETFLGRHGDSLARYHGHLDVVVPKVFAKFETEFPEAKDLPGDALCAGVRALLRHAGASSARSDDTLAMEPRGNSRHLVAADGTTARIRRHPWSHRFCRRVAVTPPEVWTLWGVDWSLAPFEIAVLWTPNYSAKSLGSASLAAVSDLDGSSPTIYWRESLPPADGLSAFHTTPAAAPDELDEFDDLLGEESTGDNDPA